MIPLLIAFGHKARNGKDTAGVAVVGYYQQKRALANVSGHTLKSFPVAGLYKFADALYEKCRKEYGMVGKDAPLLQRVGSEFREKDSGYWIKELFKSIPSTTDIAVITDLRYQNEAHFVKSLGGYTVNVIRKREDGSRYIADDRPATHPSEIDLDGYNFDYEIIGHSGQVAWVEEQAITLAEHLRALRTK